MKSSEIHNGLPEKELRDFFAKTQSEIYDKEIANKKVEIHYNRRGDVLEWSIKDAEAQITVLKRTIELLHQKIAVRSLIKEKGWEEHDISDSTANDTEYTLWLNFIGTKEEHAHLLDIINKEEE
jgi:hypothetical protein